MADFTPAEEVERILMAPRDMAGKAVGDIFREEWVEGAHFTMLTVGLVVAVVLKEGEVAVEAEGTLVEAVEIMVLTPVEEGEDLSIQEQINKTCVAITQLVMAM